MPADYSGKSDKRVVVFGWSGCLPDSEPYRVAETLGAELAKAGFSVTTGGYCGTMEGVSKGARENGGRVEGIITSAVFPVRQPKGNAFLHHVVDAPSLVSRIEVLTSRARYYVILPGTLGTLTELSVILSLSSLHPKGLPKPVIIAFTDPWKAAMEGMGAALSVGRDHLDLMQYQPDVAAVIKAITEDYAAIVGSPTMEDYTPED